MNVSELRQKSAVELDEELNGVLKEQFNLRMQQGSGQLARPHLMKQARRNVARIKTVIAEKNRAGE